MESSLPSTATLRRPRLGVLGTVGPERLSGLVASGLAEVVQRADSLDALLAQRLDGLVIGTPNALRAEQALRALEAGVAVFCQQPLARTAAETRRVIAAARRAGLLLGVDLPYRHTEGMRVLRSVVQAGELGDVFAVDVTYHSGHGPDRSQARAARLAGGGCIINLGGHVVDLALWTLGFPRVTQVTSRRYARGEPLQPGRSDAVEDFATALLELDTGATLRLSCSWNQAAGRDAIIEAAFFGTEGGGAFRNVNGSLYDFTAELYHGTSRHTLASPPDDWSGRAALEWVQRLGAGEGYDPWVEGLIDVAAALDAVLGSAG